MTLRSITLIHAAIPLRKAITHASHQRLASDNLIVRATLDDGTTGYGEGIPRPYVTGETIESTFTSLAQFDAARALGNPSDYAEVVRRLDRLALPETQADPRGMAGNAARCALELALLDAFGRKFQLSVGWAVLHALRVLLQADGLAAASPRVVRYSGAITAESPRKERISAWKLRIYGFRQVKVKVGIAGQNDPQRLRMLRRILGAGMDLRLDANEAWAASDLIETVAPLRTFRPTALEQPVRHEEVEALAELRPRIGIPVMLDESVCGYPDAVAAVERGLADLLNIRLSKCGGILPSLRMLTLAMRAGLGVQLGCHPGETGILSAAGRHVAVNLRDLRYLEGSYDRHVLRRNVVQDDVTFGYGGRARPLDGPGLGVAVAPDLLDSVTIRRLEVVYE